MDPFKKPDISSAGLMALADKGVEFRFVFDPLMKGYRISLLKGHASISVVTSQIETRSVRFDILSYQLEKAVEKLDPSLSLIIERS